MKILDIGQCGFDGPRMTRLWTGSLGATVDRCSDGAEALSRLAENAYDIIMVNRVLADDQSPGIDVIRKILSSGVKTPVMMVSDMKDAQDKAVALGAVRGFGKAQLFDQSTIDLVVRVVAESKKQNA